MRITFLSAALLIASVSGPGLAQSPRLGVVSTPLAYIRATANNNGKLLSVCPKGFFLTVLGRRGPDYAVLMANHSTGYVAGRNVRLLPYTADTSSPKHPAQRRPH